MSDEAPRGERAPAGARRLWQDQADAYDRVVAIPELLGVRRMRRRLLEGVRGPVLEVAVGTGANLGAYPACEQVLAVDFSPAMLARAAGSSGARRVKLALAVMDAGRLAIRDAAFGTVVSTLSTCSFPDPVLALREMRRVCAPGGRVLLLEHGRSTARWINWYLDRGAVAYADKYGCTWNRDPVALVEAAGLKVRKVDRTFFGIYYLIKATPVSDGGVS